MDQDATLALLEKGIDGRGIHPASGTRTTRSTRSGSGSIALTESEDGILHWDIGERVRVTRGKSKRLQSYRFEDLSPNQVSKKLKELDAWLTPDQGLREVTDGNVGAEVTPISEGRILLYIHGTFSNSENVVNSFRGTPEGQELLAWSAKEYGQVLAYDHPTLSVSPFLNALYVSRAFQGCDAEVDIICHSRGGLVTRWWLETLMPASAPACRVVFVASPLGGTGLASPANIRGTLDLLANFSKRLAFGSGVGSVVVPIAAPIFQVSAVIAGIVSSVSSAGASTPAIDAAISLVPGLAAQSRQGANDEIIALRRGFASQTALRKRLDQQVAGYHFVIANFESEDPGWAFWRVFRNMPGRVADAVTNAVFDGPNDLVVDTASMTDLADKFGQLDRERQILDFGTTNEIHHCNYFQKSDTI